VAILRTLIDSGADLNARTHLRQFTPLFFAASFGMDEAFKVLLDAGADPLITSRDRETILMRATSQNHTGIMQMCLDAGLDVSPLPSETRVLTH
jgi:ankyrin repeat protein